MRDSRQIFVRLFTGTFASINLEPTGRDENFSFRLKRFAFHAGDACGVFVLCRWKEHCDETLRHHVEHCALGIVQGAGNGAGRNDCKVITHFGVVKDPFIGLDPIIIEHFAREWIIDFC